MLNFKLQWSLCCRNLLSAENDYHELADSGHQHANRRFPSFSFRRCVWPGHQPNCIFHHKLKLQMTETERRQGAGPVAVGFGRLSVPLSCPGALQANQSPQYVLAHPYLVNPWISDRFGGFPGLTRRIVRRCVTVMTSLCSSNSSAELVPFSVWAEPRTAGGYGTLRLAIQTAESPPSPADSHWISVFSSESCTARGPGAWF